MMFAISQSELNAFRTCRQRWHLQYIKGLVPAVTPDAMRTGSLFHEAMAAVYTVMASATLQGALAAAREVVAAASVEADEFDAFDAKDADTLRHDVMAMVERYADAFYARDQAQFTVVSVEQAFCLPIKWAKGNGKVTSVPGARYIGATDVVLADRQTNEFVVMEHKTTGSDATTFDARFEVDPQTPGYVWAVREQMQNKMGLPYADRLQYDHRFGRVLLNAIRRTGPKEPRVNLDGKVSTAACDTTQSVYQAALDVQASERGIPVTAKQVERMQSLPQSMDRWVCRHDWRYSEGEVERWFMELRADAALLRQSRLGNIEPTRNGSACSMPHQPVCRWRDACVEQIGATEAPDVYTVRDVSFAARCKRARQ